MVNLHDKHAEKGVWQEQLLRILEDRFSEADLKRIAFFLLGAGSYDNLRGEAKSDKALSLLEQLEFRGDPDKIAQLIGYIKENRPEIEIEGLIPPKKRPTEIEFMNRVNEVQYITNPYSPPYLLISAPPGYGKTRLLQVVEKQFKGQVWFSMHCALQENEGYSLESLVQTLLKSLGLDTIEISFDYIDHPTEFGFLVAENLLRRVDALKVDGILLLLDQAEVLEEEVVEKFLNQIIPGLNRGLRSAGYLDQLKIILSGRYVGDWEQLSKNIRLSLMPVTPFNFPVVQQTVQRFMSNKKRYLPIESIQEIAAHIMYLTGGHPGCMVQLLKGFPVGWPARDYFIGQQDQHYEAIIAPVVNDVRRNIPENLDNIFDTLSVVRYFNSRFLRHLMDDRLIRWQKSEIELEDELTRTHLVTRSHSFLHDAITQRLLSIRLRKFDPDYFLMICKASIDFYENSLQDSGINRPDILAVELLFQKLQFVHYDHLGDKDEILNAVPEVLEKLVNGRDPREMIRSCIDLLKDDWEFSFLFNYLMRDGVYDNESPYNELIECVGEFLL